MDDAQDTLPPPLADADALPPLPLAGEGRGRGGGFEPHAASPPSGIGMLADARPAGEGVPGAPATAAGWFGKLSCLGDFASRRLPETFVAQCDAWLSSGIAASRLDLGERWLDVYLTAPLWRFALGAGLAGESWWLGAMMPSVDRVGRYFPLVVCEPFARPPCSREELDAAERWLDHLSATALSTLRPDATLDSFEARLQTAPRWLGSGPAVLPAPSRSPGHERHLATRCLPLAGWVGAIGSARLLEGLRGHSLWWAPSPEGDNTFSIAAGWPAAERFSDLLEGRW